MNRKTISSADKTKGQTFGGLKTPKLKGHLKVSLRDVITGETKVIEGDNIVTNGIKDIFQNNYLGALNYGAMLPLYQKWFGGLLCLNSAFSTVVIDGNTVPDPDDYYLQGDGVNKVIAHAGDIAPATAEIVNEDLKRGSPVAISTTENSVKFTWDFTTRQGNGIISALALTHKDIGNAGVGSTSSAFQALDPFENLASASLSEVTTNLTATDNLYCQYDDYHGVYFTIGEYGDFAPENTRFETDKITIYKKRLPYHKVGLFETDKVRESEQVYFTVSLGFNLYLQPCYYFDYTNKRLWIFSNATSINSSSSTTVHYAVIDCNVSEYDTGSTYNTGDRVIHSGVQYEATADSITGAWDATKWTTSATVSEGTITSSDLAPIPMQPNATGFVYGDQPRNYNIPCDGTNVWLPTTSGADWTEVNGKTNTNGIKKIRLSDSSTIETITYNAVQAKQGAMLKQGGLIVTSGRVTNNGVGYTCADNYPVVINGAGYTTYSFHEPDRPITFATRVGATQRGSGNQPRFLLADKFIETTKFNLPSAVEKTATQAMTVEYTLTEA